MTKPTLTDNTHPSYPSPTIQEALCEIRFVTDPVPFPVQFARVWDRLREEFPQLETLMDLLPTAAPSIVTSGPLQAQPRFVLRHASRQILLQFVPGAFTLNTLAPYSGWETMREDIATAWQSVQEVLTPSQITAINVRYINRVPLPSEDAQGWLVAGDYVAAAVVNAGPPFQSRVQTGIGDITALSVGHLPNDPQRAMIVDIERSLSGTFPVETGQVIGHADVLHEDIWNMFKAIKGPRWNDLLEGKPQ